MNYDELLRLRKEVSERIVKILLSKEFELSKDYLKHIHKYLFENILDGNGEYRTYNVTKKEVTLNGDSVIYPDYHQIDSYLDYDIDTEKSLKYHKFPLDKKIIRLSDFNSRIWLTHPFTEGNTRTISVFMQKYLILIAKKIFLLPPLRFLYQQEPQ